MHPIGRFTAAAAETGCFRIGHRGDTANEFEQRENLQRCRAIFLSLIDEPFARVIASDGTVDEVAARILTEEGIDTCGASSKRSCVFRPTSRTSGFGNWRPTHRLERASANACAP